MFKFPWGDMHSLNLGWFLQKFNELREDWATAEAGIDGALDAEIQKAEDALSDVFDARDAAAASATAAAGSASAANTSKTAAQNSATAAASSATLANQKATAAGLSEAAAAQSAKAASNSATSATQAGQSATNAAGSATNAGNSALVSEGYAKGSQNGTAVGSGSPYYQNNAKYFKEGAEAAYDAEATNALVSEGYAKGSQNGTDVGSSPYYHNNAKYFAEQAASSAAEADPSAIQILMAALCQSAQSSTQGNRTSNTIGNKLVTALANQTGGGSFFQWSPFGTGLLAYGQSAVSEEQIPFISNFKWNETTFIRLYVIIEGQTRVAFSVPYFAWHDSEGVFGRSGPGTQITLEQSGIYDIYPSTAILEKLTTALDTCFYIRVSAFPSADTALKTGKSTVILEVCEKTPTGVLSSMAIRPVNDITEITPDNDEDR